MTCEPKEYTRKPTSQVRSKFVNASASDSTQQFFLGTDSGSSTHYRVHKSPLLITTLSQITLVDTSITYALYERF
jgi:hypothetical protein